MTTPIRDKATGQVHGSVGDGRSQVPGPAHVLVMPMTARQATAMTSLADVLATLKLPAEAHPAVEALMQAADRCAVCDTRVGYGTPFDFVHHGELAVVCDLCVHGTPVCDCCERHTDAVVDEFDWVDRQLSDEPFPTPYTRLCWYCVRQFQ